MNPSLWKQKAIFLGMAFCATFVFLPNETMAAEIQDVKVQIESGNHEMPLSVKKRITESITSVGERIFSGKDDRLFLANQKQYDKVLSDIVNRVVIGYMVTDLHVDYGKQTMMHVTLQPVGESIQTVETVVDYGSLSKEAISYVKKDAMHVGHLMESLLVGLPIDSIGWAENVSQSAGKDLLAKVLPEFDTNFEVTPGKHTKVRIYLIPKGAIIRSSEISFRRMDIPRLIMLKSVWQAEEMLKALEGLPVTFVNRHYDEISSDLEKTLQNNSIIQKYKISVHTELQGADKSILFIDATTQEWMIRTEGWFDINRKENKNYAFHGVLGYSWNKNDRIFSEVIWYPGPMKWNFFVGMNHRFGNGMYAGGKYDIVNRHTHVFGQMKISDRMMIDYDRNVTEAWNEFGLLYKLHNYMTVEYVYNNKDGNWFRLIANL